MQHDEEVKGKGKQQVSGEEHIGEGKGKTSRLLEVAQANVTLTFRQ